MDYIKKIETLFMLVGVYDLNMDIPAQNLEMTRQTNWVGPEIESDDEHKNCHRVPCANCTNGILLQLKLIREGSMKMGEFEVAKMEKMLKASQHYPFEP